MPPHEGQEPLLTRVPLTSTLKLHSHQSHGMFRGFIEHLTARARGTWAVTSVTSSRAPHAHAQRVRVEVGASLRRCLACVLWCVRTRVRAHVRMMCEKRGMGPGDGGVKGCGGPGGER